MNFFVKHKKKLIFGLVALVAIVLLVNRQGNGQKITFSEETVKKTDLIESIEETGTVVSETKLNYGFELAGQVVKVEKKVGDSVKKGDLIAEIDPTKELQNYRQAEAVLLSARALLNLKKAGPSKENIEESLVAIEKTRASLNETIATAQKTVLTAENRVSVARKNLESAESDLKIKSETGLSRILSDAYANARNTLSETVPVARNALISADNILGIDNPLANDTYEDSLGVRNQQSLFRAENLFYLGKSARDTIISANSAIENTSDTIQIDRGLLIASDSLSEIENLLSSIVELLQNSIPVGSVTETMIDNLKTGIITQISAITAEKSAIDLQIQNLKNAENSLNLAKIARDKAAEELRNAENQAKSDLALSEASIKIAESTLKAAEAAHASLIAPPRNIDLSSLEADVIKAEAGVLSARRELEKTKLFALSDGVISRQDLEVGENIAPNTPLVSIISPELYIEVDISESDIAKASIGQKAEIYFDAFGKEEAFEGSIVEIEPGETVISGVIYYRAKLNFSLRPELEVRPGMTANIKIITAERNNVIAIPNRAIILNADGTRLTRVINNDQEAQNGRFEERPIKTGLRAGNGYVEIISGLNEGERIVTEIKR